MEESVPVVGWVEPIRRREGGEVADVVGQIAVMRRPAPCGRRAVRAVGRAVVPVGRTAVAAVRGVPAARATVGA